MADLAPKGHLRAVFLDVGGTLLREARPRWSLYAAAARARGLAVDDGSMRQWMRSAHDELPRELNGAFRYSDPWFEAFIRSIFRERLGLPEAELEGLTRELFDLFERGSTFRVYPGAHALLSACRARGLALCAISNWSERLERVLSALGLGAAFDFVLCSARERLEKPDPALFRLALARAGVPAAAALHAGDDPQNDGRGARAAGLSAVLVDHDDRLGEAAAAGGFPRVRGLPELGELILSRLP
jgi:putative hydrolase of the HAD superfamily